MEYLILSNKRNSSTAHEHGLYGKTVRVLQPFPFCLFSTILLYIYFVVFPYLLAVKQKCNKKPIEVI